MNVGTQGNVRGIGYALTIGHVSFAPNGTSDPLQSAVLGGAARFITGVTYQATGQYTVQFSNEFVFANNPVFHVSAQAESLANWYDVLQIGQYNTATRQLVIQSHRNGTGYAPPANTGCRVRIAIFALDTTGK